jgi:hypothetical protein
MTIDEYRTCLNHVGRAAWEVAQATRVANDEALTLGVSDALELARLALHTLVSSVAEQAEREHGWAATLDAFGDPWANMGQLEYQVSTGEDAPYWLIA